MLLWRTNRNIWESPLNGWGGWLRDQGDMEKALVFSNRIQTNHRGALYAANPRIGGSKKFLGISYSKLGDIFQDTGQNRRGFDLFEKDLKFTEELYAANPRSESLKNGLAISYLNLGEIFQAQENETRR